MSSEMADMLNELFFGAGSWLGLLLLLGLIIAISVKTKYSGVFMLPVCIGLAISYLDYPALMWNAIIMFFTSVFLVVNLFRDQGQG